MGAIRSFLVVLNFTIGVVGPAFAQEIEPSRQRVALVIANANYQDGDKPLAEPINDARAIAYELRQSGFEVELGEDLPGTAMRDALKRLEEKLVPGSTVVFFFSGYGIQANRQSYLIPIDGRIWSESDLRRDSISLESILANISDHNPSVEVAILDSSRRNPFERRLRKVARGLSPVAAPSNSLVMYSAAPDTLAV